MLDRIRYPSLYQINTRLYLTELGRVLGRPATLDDIPAADLEGWQNRGFDWLWFLGVWQTGAAGRQVALANPEWRRDYQELLADFTDADVTGSCFAVTSYTLNADFGGDLALTRLRERLHARGLRLMLDFVPNHTALDHPWVLQHPNFYIAGDEADRSREPWNYTRVSGPAGSRILAHGRDPCFPGWPDALQLNYGNPALHDAAIEELQTIADQCDGVRCDMAMLLLPEVFQRTWGVEMEPFWPRALQEVGERHPDFVFMAEVYWDLEWMLQQQGFDYCYDKRLYDRLVAQQARLVRLHLQAGLDFQDRLVRFLENHDEPRAAAVFPPEIHRAAAVVNFFTPGLRFFHQGQLEGARKKVPVHLGRGPREAVDESLREFYDRLLTTLQDGAVRTGEWRLLDCQPAWEGNTTQDDFLAFTWSKGGDEFRLVTVNYGPNQGQCHIRLPWPELAGRRWRLQDRLSDAVCECDGEPLLAPGLYLDLPPWGYHVFVLNAVD